MCFFNTLFNYKSICTVCNEPCYIYVMLLTHKHNKNINRNMCHNPVTEQVTYLTYIWQAPASNHCQKQATL